ncbi:hypothetical protein JCM33374_g927 [Metschnikowia sp. JCM 33374]|nr:hypothetical protein JCM33374_g927 [Metschnikowia sp. JCM 33374]
MDPNTEPEAKRPKLSPPTMAAPGPLPGDSDPVPGPAKVTTDHTQEAFLGPVIAELNTATEPGAPMKREGAFLPETRDSAVADAPAIPSNDSATYPTHPNDHSPGVSGSFSSGMGAPLRKDNNDALPELSPHSPVHSSRMPSFQDQPKPQSPLITSASPPSGPQSIQSPFTAASAPSNAIQSPQNAASVISPGPPPPHTTNVKAEAPSGALRTQEPPNSSVNTPQSVSDSRKHRLVVIDHVTVEFADFLDGLRNDTNDTITETALAGVSSLETPAFDQLHFCVVINDSCEESLEKLRSFLHEDPQILSNASKVSLHFDFSEMRNWTSAPEPLKASYTSLLDKFEKTCAQKVVQCSFINRYSPVSGRPVEQDDLAQINKDSHGEISRWHNLEVLDYGRSSLRFVSGVRFPESLRALNLGGGHSLEALTGFKLPGQLRSLDVSHNLVSSTDYVAYPATLEVLNLRDNRIYFMNNVEFPVSLKHLDLSQNRIDNLKSVVFPRNLKSLSISNNPIECIKGVRFPESIEYLDASCLPNESMTGIKFPDHTRSLNLQSAMTNTRGLKLPPYVESLNMACDGVNSINPLKLPNSIQRLYLAHNNIKTLNKVAFPASIRELYLGNNMITTLKNVQFPPTLEVLDMTMDPHNDENEKYVTSLKDVFFPANLRVLRLGYHSIKTIEAVDFPYGLEELGLQYNDLRVFRNVKFGPRLHTLDLSGNQELVSLDNVFFPESLRDLRLPSLVLNSLPGVLVERANNHQLKLSKSLPYTI